MTLRKIIFLFPLFSLLASLSSAQTTLAKWTFETSAPTTGGPITPELGSGSALSNTGGTFSSPAGNGTAKSWSSNNWDVGEYFQFSTSTTGYEGISVSWSQISSNTGPRDFALYYSTDGSNFTQVATYTALANAAPNTWTSGTSISAAVLSYNLVSATTLDNQAAVYFRLVDMSTTSANASTVAVGGTDRIDNFTITAAATVSAVPEPSTYAAIAGALVLAGTVTLRRRKSHVAV